MDSDLIWLDEDELPNCGPIADILWIDQYIPDKANKSAAALEQDHALSPPSPETTVNDLVEFKTKPKPKPSALSRRFLYRNWVEEDNLRCYSNMHLNGTVRRVYQYNQTVVLQCGEYGSP